MNMPGRKFNAGSGYRYGFNGQENDNSSGEGNLDFDARILEVRLGRWLSIDFKFNRLPEVSPYNYCMNSPLILSDPNGEYPIVVITNTVTGYTFAHAYGAENSKTEVIIVKTYKAIIYDVDEKGNKTRLGAFNVTRDGYYNLGERTFTEEKEESGFNSGGTFKYTHTVEDLVNRTSEPLQTITVNATTKDDHYSNSGVGDIALKPFNAEATPKEWDVNNDGTPVPGGQDGVKRDDPKIASSVMIHIGGVYTNYDGNTTLAGYYGCYGVIDASQVFSTLAGANKKLDEVKKSYAAGTVPTGFTTSNVALKRVMGLVQTAFANANKRNEKSARDIKVTIQKRDSKDYAKKKVNIISTKREKVKK